MNDKSTSANTKMSGLSDNDFKDVVINMLQQTLRNTLETNKKKKVSAKKYEI